MLSPVYVNKQYSTRLLLKTQPKTANWLANLIIVLGTWPTTIWITQTNYEMGHLLDYGKLRWC